MSYTFDQHLHNYAVWTAARAVNRNLTTTRNIKDAIEQSGLKAFSFEVNGQDAASFETFHRKCANQLITALKSVSFDKTTYGRAAKIIAIYLKTSIIIPSAGEGNACNIIHPPIDRILLTNLSKKFGSKELTKEGWTSLNECQYWNLVKRIKELVEKENKTFDWTLEEYWHPEQEKETLVKEASVNNIFLS